MTLEPDTRDEEYVVLVLDTGGEKPRVLSREQVPGGLKAASRRVRELWAQTLGRRGPANHQYVSSYVKPSDIARVLEAGLAAVRVGDRVVAAGTPAALADLDSVISRADQGAKRSAEMRTWEDIKGRTLAVRLATKGPRLRERSFSIEGEARELSGEEYAERIALLGRVAGEDYAMKVVEAAASDGRPPDLDEEAEAAVLRWLVSPDIEPCPSGFSHHNELMELFEAIYGGHVGLTAGSLAQGGLWETQADFRAAAKSFMETTRIREGRCMECGQAAFRRAGESGLPLDLLKPARYPAPAIVALARHRCGAGNVAEWGAETWDDVVRRLQTKHSKESWDDLPVGLRRHVCTELQFADNWTFATDEERWSRLDQLEALGFTPTPEELQSARAYAQDDAKKGTKRRSRRRREEIHPRSVSCIPAEARERRSELSLWPWQVDAIDWWSGRKHRGVVEAITGAGKTRVGLAATLDALADSTAVTVVVPTLDLVDQWFASLSSALPPSATIGKIGGDHEIRGHAPDVVIGTVHSIAGRNLGLPAEGFSTLIVADETHRYGGERWSACLENEYGRRLGLTATLERLDDGVEQRLTPYFGAERFELGYARALEDRVIAPFRIALLEVDFSAKERERYEEATEKMHDASTWLVENDFVPAEPYSEMFNAIQRLAGRKIPDGKPVPTEVRRARSFMKGFSDRRKEMAEASAKLGRLSDIAPVVDGARGAIVFAQTGNACRDAIDALARDGITGRVLTSDMNRDERRETLASFRDDDSLAVIAAPRLLDEGVDVPDADLGIILAGSRTRRQVVQRLGRVIRRKADGRAARLAYFYVRGTSEDPNATDHEPTVLDELRDVALESEAFPPDARAGDIVDFLSQTSSPAGTG